MNLVNEIRNYLANSEANKAYLIGNVDKDYPAYVFRDSDSFGVLVPYEGKKVYEEFSNVYMYSEFRSIGDIQGDWLFLCSQLEETRNTFATICADFVSPGNEGRFRKALVNNPSKWWNDWKTAIGNRNSNKQPHTVVGELLVYEMLVKKGIKCKWTGSNYTTHDLMSDNCDYEIKSSTKRYGRMITVSGQYQFLKGDKDLKLVYIKFEKNPGGISINDMVDRLSDLGISRESIDNELDRIGYRVGSSIRNEKYSVLESLEYNVDDSFPKIIPASFKGDSEPEGIQHIVYDVNLSILSGTALDLK